MTLYLCHALLALMTVTKLTYCRISGLLKLDEFSEDIQEVLTTFKNLR